MSDRNYLYVAFGDSLTEGIGAESPGRNFVSQVFDQIRRSHQCDLKNMGISGMQSGELLQLLQNKGTTRLLSRLTHCSVTTGGCDFIDLYESGSVTIPRILHRAHQVHYNTKRVLETIRFYNRDAKLYLLGFYLPLPAYEMGVSKASWYIQMMNRAFKRLASSYQATMINPFDIFLKRTDFFADEVHPNQQGYDQLARLFIERIAPERIISEPIV